MILKLPNQGFNIEHISLINWEVEIKVLIMLKYQSLYIWQLVENKVGKIACNLCKNQGRLCRYLLHFFKVCSADTEFSTVSGVTFGHGCSSKNNHLAQPWWWWFYSKANAVTSTFKQYTDILKYQSRYKKATQWCQEDMPIANKHS